MLIPNRYRQKVLQMYKNLDIPCSQKHVGWHKCADVDRSPGFQTYSKSPGGPQSKRISVFIVV